MLVKCSRLTFLSYDVQYDHIIKYSILLDIYLYVHEKMGHLGIAHIQYLLSVYQISAV